MDQQNDLTLGQYLKEAREKANFTIEKFSLKTRINANILRNLENEDFKSLPNLAYLKGFVLNYVKMFSLDEAEAIKKLQDSYVKKTGESLPSHGNKQQVKVSSKKMEEPDEVINNSENIIDTTKSFVPYLLGLILIAVCVGGYQVVSKMINKEARKHKDEVAQLPIESSQENNSTEEPVIEEAPQEIDEVKVETPPTPEPPVEVKKEVIPATKIEKKAEVKAKKDGKRNFPTVEFKSIPTELYTIKKDAPENKDDSLMPRSYKAKMNPELQNLYVHALDGETWLSYKVDDENIQNEFVRQGKALFLQGKVIRMFFGNINVTKIFLNNNFIDAYSTSGVKTVVFPEEQASNFKRPLFLRSSQGELYTSEEYMEKMKEEESSVGNP